ncbi:M56 family metallopeptidase [Blastopirellula retiformator]|uniref:Thiol-disulfide oxidoreductase ResA n=1 Tax=Blastopirellula retiformator TaxID=2527970 RepID=A0A5C5V4Q2_9BACT|nr:M56 family metallopeptidase [Blastopirellula retiformator]TWT33040.1 Thiol-disulfide oxidoreductase ResA [Blastopirellula retiformator]
MTIANLISTDELARLGAALCHFLWQGAVLGVIAAVLSVKLRRTGPQVRYAVFLSLLVISPCCLLTTYVWLLSQAAPVVSEELVAEPPTPQPIPLATSGPEAPAEPPVGLLPPHVEPIPVTHSPSGFDTAFSLLALLWGIGVALLSLRLIGGYWRVRCYAGRDGMPLDPTWMQRAERLAETMQIKRRIVWLQSTIIQTPLTFGWLRPIVVTPSALLSGLTVAEVECLLAHELAHIRRHDFVVNLLQSAVETLLFYHPAIWWISRQIRFEREQICDEIAIQVVGDRVTYGKALLSVATAAPVETLAMAAGDSDLKRRIQRIFGIGPNPASRNSRFLGAIGAGLLMIVGLTIALLGNMAPNATADDAIPPVELFIETPTLRLQPIAGRVFGSDVKPAADVEVILRSNHWFSTNDVLSKPRGDIAATRTNAEGRYRFEDVPFNLGQRHERIQLSYLPLDVAAVGQGQSVGWRHLQGDQPHLSADITLSPPATLAGQVVDPQGRPVAGAQVRVMYGMSIRHITQADLEEGRWPKYSDRDFINFRDSRAMPQTTTDAEGRFRLTGLPPRRGFGLQIRHPNFVDDFAFAATIAELEKRDRDLMKRNVQTGEVRIELQEGRKLTFQVVADDTGQPLKGAKQHDYGHYRETAKQIADEHGRMTSVEPPTTKSVAYIISPPAGADYLPTSSIFNFEEDQREALITVRLQKGAVIAGKVVDQETGKGMPNLAFNLTNTKGSPERSGYNPVATDAQGKFRTVVAPGKIVATHGGAIYSQPSYEFAREDQRPPSWDAALQRPIDDALIPIKLAPTIDGMIYDSHGQPLGDVAINYQIPFASSADGIRGYISQQVLADDQGRFSLIHLNHVWKQDWVKTIPVTFRDRRSTQQRTISLDESAWQAPLEVYMRSTSVVSGRLIDADLKRPIRKGSVDLYYLVPPADGEGAAKRHHASFHPNQEGRFRLEIEHEGECETLRLTPADYQERMLSGDGAQRQLSFDKPLDLGDILVEPVGSPEERQVDRFVMPPYDPALGKAEFARLERQFAVDHAAYQQERTATSSRRIQQLLDERADPTPEYLFAMLAIAKANRDTETCFAALHWIAKLPYDHRRAAAHYPQQRHEAVEMLLAGYAHRPQLADCVDKLLYRQDPDADPISKRMERADQLIAKNQSRVARGRACYSIGMQLTEKNYPPLPSPNKANELAKQYLQRVIDEFADIPLYQGRTIGESAERQLYELRYLQPGSPAPEISGIDSDGKPLKLSDLKGKIVLLNFWGSWCGPCIFKLPGLQKLAEDFPDQLVILGVMSDTPEAARKAIDEHQVQFRNLVDGPHAEGKIVRQWNINRWPTSYLIDGEGKIVSEVQGEEMIRASIERLATQASPR